MAEAYQKRYGQPFFAIQNTIDVAALEFYAKQPATVGRPVRVAYIGSIFPFAQLDSLVDICRAVQQLRNDGLDIRMEIYSPTFLSAKYRDQLVAGDAVDLYDTIQDDNVFFSTLQAVDVLALPVNFDDYTHDYIRYSMPTKVPAYLTIGTPILAYGPADVAQIAYASTAGWGLTVTQRSHDLLCEALRTLASDKDLRVRLSHQARQTALACHDSTIVRAQFQTVLSRAETAVKACL
jgi:glycosyltransferase involved in cell wall biosynthesis